MKLMFHKVVFLVFLVGLVLRPSANAGPSSGSSFGGSAGFRSSAPSPSFRSSSPPPVFRSAPPTFRPSPSTYRPSPTASTWRSAPAPSSWSPAPPRVRVTWAPERRYVTSTTHVYYVATPIFHHGRYWDHYYQDNGVIYFEDQVTPYQGGGCNSPPTPEKHHVDAGPDIAPGETAEK